MLDSCGGGVQELYWSQPLGGSRDTWASLSEKTHAVDSYGHS